MYTLLRPHHSIYLLNNDELCSQFTSLAKQNPHITIIFGLEGESDILFQWRLAFNMWIFLRTDDDALYINNERTMIYPTINFIIEHIMQSQTVKYFKINYRQDELLVFIASLLLVNECIRWYENIDLKDPTIKNMTDILMKTDIYQIFQTNAKNNEQIPRSLTEAITKVFKSFKEKIDTDRDYFLKAIDVAIQEAKKMYRFILEVG